MPAGSMPSWVQTSSSAAIFGGGSNTNAPSTVKSEPAIDKAASSASTQQQNTSTAYSSSQTAAVESAGPDQEKPYKPKRKQKSVTHCPPLTSVASSSRAPYAIPYIDAPSSEEALSRLIAVQAKRAGFDASTASALHEVRQLTKKFLTSVFTAATHAAELSARDHPSARDLIYALETHGQPIRELRDFHRQQERDAKEQDEKKQNIAEARGKARQQARPPITYKAKGRRLPAQQDSANETDLDSTPMASKNFLPSDSDDGSELDTWSVSSHSDDEHPNRRSAIQARVAKRKHDLTRALAKKRRRQAKLQQATSGQQSNTPTSSTPARDLRALTSGEQAWRRVADHIVPRHLPGMPPRHAWVQTPAFPTNAYGSSLGGGDELEDDTAADNKSKKDPLMLVNRKLANARLVEASLRRLIQNTDVAAASAYASTANVATEKPGMQSTAAVTAISTLPDKEAAAPPPSSSGFVVPKTPSSTASGLTLRLKNKISLPTSAANSPSQPSTPIVSRRPSTTPFDSTAGANASTVGIPGTTLGMAMSMGWGGEPLMSPLTPATATAPGGPMTPYPPTPGGVYGHYFSSNPGAAPTGTPGGGCYRSRSQSVVAANLDSYDADGNAGPDKLGVRVPGPVNYKNVWYAPGSTIASGGLSGGAVSNAKATAGNSNHPRSVKRMRKWRV